jgi:hypothetical protein
MKVAYPAPIAKIASKINVVLKENKTFERFKKYPLVFYFCEVYSQEVNSVLMKYEF